MLIVVTGLIFFSVTLAAKARQSMRDPAPILIRKGSGLVFIQPMVRLANGAVGDVLHASAVAHAEPECPSARAAAEDKEANPNGFQSPRQWGRRQP